MKQIISNSERIITFCFFKLSQSGFENKGTISTSPKSIRVPSAHASSVCRSTEFSVHSLIERLSTSVNCLSDIEYSPLYFVCW